MLIGINLLYLIPNEVGGTETYARELIPALARQLRRGDKIVLFCSIETSRTFSTTQNIDVVTLPFYSKNRAVRMLIEQLILPFICIQHNISVLFSLGYSQPIFLPCKSVVTIHDLNWHYHPEDFNLTNRIIWQLITKLSARFSTHIITDSTASRESIIGILGVSAKKTTAILHGSPTKLHLDVAERKQRLKSLKVSKPYIFTLISSAPHKNLATLLSVFESLSKTNPEISLVIAGLGQKQKYNVNNVMDLGYVSRKDLACLYSEATIFVFPSAYEGFGYPVVEAMQYGTPVVSSDAFSLKEVVGNNGLLTPTFSVGGYLDNIHSILSSKDIRKNLVKKGKKRSDMLSWKLTASKTLSILHKVQTNND